MISIHILKITFLNKPELVFFFFFFFWHTVKWFHLISNNSVQQKYSLLFTLKDQIFQIIHFSMQTKLNGSKYCYVSLTIELNIDHLFAYS